MNDTINLTELYETSDIDTIFDTLGEDTEIDTPAAILLPIRQIRFIELEKNDIIKVDVVLVTRKKKFGIISINPRELESLNLFEKFGFKNNEWLSKDEWERCLKIFFKLAPHVPETVVYKTLGSIPGKNEFVFANRLLTSNSYNEIENDLIKGIFPVKSVSADFFLDKYIPLFNDQTNGLIFLFTLLLSTGLSRISEISAERPSWVVAVIADTGSFKTSTVNAALNPFQGSSCTSMSFEASISVITNKLMDCRDMVSIIDDYYTNSDRDMTSKLESIIRLNGDTASGRQRMSGKKYLVEDCNTISVITGETFPKVRFSSKPRMLVIDLKNGINLSRLTELQSSQPEFRGALMDFIQYTLADDKYSEKLIESFKVHRRNMVQTQKCNWHGRYTSMCAWYLAIYDVFCDYCILKNVSCDNILSFPENIRKFIAEQSKRYLESDSTYIFFKTIKILVDEGKVKAISEAEITNDTLKTDIIYTDDQFWIESTIVYEKVLQYCIQEGIVFGSSRMDVYRKLSEDGLLLAQNGKLTGEYRKGKFRESTVCFGRNNIRRYFSYGNEVEGK